jgi:hypothetical protein
MWKIGRRSATDGGGSLPDVSAAPRRYRSALIGAAIRAVRAASKGAEPIHERPVAERAARVDQYWHFLEAELDRQKLGGLRAVQAHPGLRQATQDVHEWFARLCGIRPATVACVAWADRLNRETEAAYVQANPNEPSWKWRLQGPICVPALADDPQGGPSLDGVVTADGSSFRFSISGSSSGVAFEADSISRVSEVPDGYRLEVGEPCPYPALLLLAVSGNAALGTALSRAGVRSLGQR